MKTDELIRALAADGLNPPARLGPGILRAFLLGLVPAVIVFTSASFLGPRADIATAVGDPRFLFKFVVTLILAASAFAAVLQLARPERRAPPLLLLAGPAVLAIGVLVELVLVPAASWPGRMLGSNARICLTAIPLLSLPMLAAGLYALRRGAPASPAMAGAVAGLVSGGLAATLYASHCTDDSPLFVAAWYTPAVGIVTAAGALAGRRLLRW